VVIITGGASGIGEATTRLFVANGAHVYIADIDRDKGSRLSEELGERVQYLYCDVRKEEDVAATVDKTIQEKGKLDIYFSNAGFVGALGSIDKLSLADFDETLAVNLRGAVVSIKHAARVMKPVRRGAIICTGSVASELGGLGPHTYCISKTALKGLVRSTALELRSYGIRVNMVSPDATPTPMFMKVIKDGTGIPMTFEQAKSTMAKKSLILDRPLADLDVANAVLFLASEEAGYISGHNLLLDAAKTVTVPFPAGYDHWFAGYAPMLK
jgi:xanthoxin dehydrogenase